MASDNVDDRVSSLFSADRRTPFLRAFDKNHFAYISPVSRIQSLASPGSDSVTTAPTASGVSGDQTPPVSSNILKETASSGLPVAAWVGIGFGILFLLILGLVLFFGHKKVTDYLVAKLTRTRMNQSQGQGGRILHQTPILPTPTRSQSGYTSKLSQTCSSSTPRTAIPDIPFASIEIEPDGRLSPRLPIPNKRGSSLPGTPCSRGGK
jgi:hypothetical protein